VPRGFWRLRPRRYTQHVRGRGGTASMIGLLAASRIGVFVSRSMIENTAAR
jgi:hypothetical protein